MRIPHHPYVPSHKRIGTTTRVGGKKVHETDRYYRVRMHEPVKGAPKRTLTFSEKKGLKAVREKKDGEWGTQAVLVEKRRGRIPASAVSEAKKLAGDNRREESKPSIETVRTKSVIMESKTRAERLSGHKIPYPIRFVGDDEPEWSGSMAVDEEKHEIQVHPRILDEMHKDQAPNASLSDFATWKLLHESYHIQHPYETEYIPREHREYARTGLSGKYMSERDASLYANRFIKLPKLLRETLEWYDKGKNDHKDMLRVLRKEREKN